MADNDITLFANLKVADVDASQIKNELATHTPKEIEEGFRAVNKAVMGIYNDMSKTAREAAKSQSEAWQAGFKSQVSTVSKYADHIKYAFLDFQSKTSRGKDNREAFGTLIDELSKYPTVIHSVKANLEELHKTMGKKQEFALGDVSTVQATIESYNRLNGVATQVYNSLNQAFHNARRNMDTEAQEMLKTPRNMVSEYVDTLRMAFLNWHMGGDVMGEDLYNNLLGAMNAAKDCAPLMSALGTEVQSVDADTVKLAQDAERVEVAVENAQEALAGGTGGKSPISETTTECRNSTDALNELKREYEEFSNKGKQSADNVNNAHKNFQSTLTSVRYALSAIGINSSSILGKMITLVGLLEDAFRGAGSAAQSIIPILGVFLSIGMSVFGTLIKWARKLLNVIVSIGHKLVEVSTKAFSVAKKAVTSLTDKIKGFINFFKPSLAKLKKWLMQWGLGARSPYFVIRKIRTMVIEGMKEIAQYSDSVATSMNNFKTALNQVKGSVVSAFEPVASYVLPVLTRLLNILASVLDAVARFNATLLGRSSYFKFVADDVTEYGNAVSEAGKASKKAQKDLMGFDEINRLSAPNEGGSAGASNDSTGKYVETAIDNTVGISKWAQRIREAWIEGFRDENGDYVVVQTFEESMKKLYDVFWEIGFKIGVNINAGLLKFNSNVNNYKQIAMKIGQSLAAAINGLVGVPSLGYNIGAAIANLFNVVFSGLHQFAVTVHWDKVGKFIGDGIAGGLTTFDWYQFFDTIVSFVNGLADLIYNVAVGHDWGSIGRNIAQAIFDALKKFDATKAGQAVHEFLGAVLDFINGFVDQMSTKQKVSVHADVDPKTGKLLSGEVISEYKTGWDLLAEKISDFWDNLGSGELGEKAGNIASGGFFGFFKILSGGASMMDSVKEFLDGFVKNITNYPWQSAMHDWWDVFYPKLKSFLSWAWDVAWEFISGPVFDFGKKFGEQIAKGIWESLKSGTWNLLKKIPVFGDLLQGAQDLGENIGELTYDVFGDSLIDSSKYKGAQDAGTSRSQMEDNNKKYVESLTPDQVKKVREGWDTLGKESQELLKKYSHDFDDLATKTASTSAQVQTSTQKTSDAIQQSNSQIQASQKQTCTAAQSAAEKGKQANDKTQRSAKDTSVVVQQTSQQQQQSYAEAGAASVNMGNTSINSFSSMATAGLDAFNSLGTASDNAYTTMTTTFDGATGYFQDLWTTVTDTFSVNGDIAQGLATGMGIIMNSSVNKMIDAINTYAIDPLIKLSNAVELIKSFSFGGLKPFASLPKLNFFRIPKLAQGAVLPPNQPFLSMVGDQKSGTNVEAPLETIKQAVAEVMMENNDLLTAGFEAVVRAIQNKDMSVRIGDKDVYEANSNYEKRLNIMRGTV